MSKRKVHWSRGNGLSTLCGFGTSEDSFWPEGGAVVGLYHSDVTCKWCLRQLEHREGPRRFEKLPECPQPRLVPIGTRILVRAEAKITRQHGLAELKPYNPSASWWMTGYREAIVVGWVKRWTVWTISGARSWDGEEPIATPRETAELLRIRYTPNGAEKLVFPQDARLLQ